MDGEREGGEEEQVEGQGEENHSEYRPEIAMAMFERVVSDVVECPC